MADEANTVNGLTLVGGLSLIEMLTSLSAQRLNLRFDRCWREWWDWPSMSVKANTTQSYTTSVRLENSRWTEWGIISCSVFWLCRSASAPQIQIHSTANNTMRQMSGIIRISWCSEFNSVLVVIWSLRYLCVFSTSENQDPFIMECYALWC